MEVGSKVLYKGDEYEILSKALIDFSVLNNVIRKADVYGLSIGIFWAEELQEVESFEDIQMSWIRNVGNVPQSVTYPYDELELAYRHLVKLHDLVSDYKCNYDLITIKRDRNAKR